MWKDVEGMGLLILGTLSEYARIAGVLVEIRTEYKSNSLPLEPTCTDGTIYQRIVGYKN
jgi:hypothetical protein